jgi:hypothetical protein
LIDLDRLIATDQDLLAELEDLGERGHEGAANSFGRRPRTHQPALFQSTGGELEELDGVEVSRVRAVGAERVRFDQVRASCALQQGTAPVRHDDLDPAVRQESLQGMLTGTVRIAFQQPLLRRHDLEDGGVLRRRSKAGGPGGVAGSEPDDGHLLRHRVDQRGNRAEDAVDSSEGQPAVMLAVDRYAGADAFLRDRSQSAGILLEQGQGPGDAIQPTPQCFRIGHDAEQQDHGGGQWRES